MRNAGHLPALTRMEGKMMNKKLTSYSIALVALLAFSSVCAAQGFTDFSLNGLDGKTLSTETLRENKVLVVKLGATWCGYCRQET